MHAAGGSTAEIDQSESLDLNPISEGSAKLDSDALYRHFPHNRMEASHYMGGTIVEGDWKFYRGYGLIESLLNLKSDSMERANILAKNPQVADRLRGKLDRWLKEISAKMPKKT